MPTEILATGTTAANSSDVVVAAGGTLTVSLKDSAGPDLGPSVHVDILLKDDAGQYFPVDTLYIRRRAVQIVAAGTYRFSRTASVDPCGVFSG
jgi:hypothetical protein